MADKVNYHKLNQMITLISCNAECGILTEQINVGFHSWYSSVALVNVLISITIRKKPQNKFAFTWEGQQYTFPHIHHTNLFNWVLIDVF